MVKVILFLVLLGANTFLNAEVQAKFDCSYQTFADSDGVRNYNRPFKFKIIWDTEKKLATYIKDKQTKKLKISDSIDMVSFVDMSNAGRVTTTSINKNSGMSVYSVNRFGLSHQAYGICKFTL